MAECNLLPYRILVVEDEYMLADELQSELSDAGAVVLGPVGRLDRAVDLVGREQRIDGAILDINLGGEMVYPVADLLMSRGTPFVFTTGYDPSAIPSRYDHIARWEKPVSMTKVAQSIARIIRDRNRQAGRASGSGA